MTSYYSGTEEEICRQKKFFVYYREAWNYIHEQIALGRGQKFLNGKPRVYKCRFCVGHHIALSNGNNNRARKKYQARRRCKKLAWNMNHGVDHQMIMEEIELGF